MPSAIKRRSPTAIFAVTALATLALFASPALAGDDRGTIRVVLQPHPDAKPDGHVLSILDSATLNLSEGTKEAVKPGSGEPEYRFFELLKGADGSGTVDERKRIDYRKGGTIELNLGDVAHEFHKDTNLLERYRGKLFLTIRVLAKDEELPIFARDGCKVDPRSGGTITLDYEIVDTPNHAGHRLTPKIRSCVETYVVVDKALKDVEVKESQPIRVAAGAVERKREEYTVRHAVGVQKGHSLDAELATKWLVVEANIRTHIERTTSTTFETSKTSSREVEIHGGNKPIKLVWVEHFVTGRAITIIDGKKFEVPFEFREGWDLRSKVVEE